MAMIKPIFLSLLIFLSLSSAFQGGISEFFRVKRNNYKNISFFSHLGRKQIIEKDKAEESNLGKDFEIDEVVIPDGGMLEPYSLINFRQRKGEMLIPCFGMWWPVGGSDVVYEYTENDYGEDNIRKKKKRKVKKQKKTSKVNKRKRL